jgi:cytochrome c-type biogenesis protein CcmF
VVITAVAVSSTMGTSKEVQLRKGETATIGDYAVTFVNAERLTEPHRESVQARMEIRKHGREAGWLFPRMNQYENQREPIGTPAVRSGLTEDLYLSVHNIDVESGSVGLLILVNPMVLWIWIATAVMALGGLVSLVPSARGARAPARVSAPAAPLSNEGSR